MRLVLPAAAVVALAVACGGSSLAYARLESVTLRPSGERLVITGYHGPCDEVLAPEVVETSSAVRLRIPLRRQGGDCEDIGLVMTPTVTLEQPLGDRAVLDVESGRQLPVGQR